MLAIELADESVDNNNKNKTNKMHSNIQMIETFFQNFYISADYFLKGVMLYHRIVIL